MTGHQIVTGHPTVTGQQIVTGQQTVAGRPPVAGTRRPAALVRAFMAVALVGPRRAAALVRVLRAVAVARPHRRTVAGARWAAAVLTGVLAVTLLVAGCGGGDDDHPPDAAPASTPPTGTAAAPPPVRPSAGPSRTPGPRPRPPRVTSWIYQLQDYQNDRLDAIAAGPYQLAVIDLARDAHADYFTPAEIAKLHRRGKRVLAYFEIGSMERFRPEYSGVRSANLLLNRWDEWPEEWFARYWDERWWQRVVRPRVDQALRAGFDGVYLDTPLAYEQIDLKLVPGRTRTRLAREMAALIIRISRYAKSRRPGFWIFPQNSPELRHQPGYLAAIDGIGMEELFYEDTNQPCREDYCAENLADTRAIRAAGKQVLAVDYVTTPRLVADTCARYRKEGFAGYPAVLALDRVSPPCR